MKKIIGLGLVALSLMTVMTDQAEARLFRRHRGCNSCQQVSYGCQAPQGMYDPNAPQMDPNAPQPNYAPQQNYAPPAQPAPPQPQPIQGNPA